MIWKSYMLFGFGVKFYSTTTTTTTRALAEAEAWRWNIHRLPVVMLNGLRRDDVSRAELSHHAGIYVVQLEQRGRR
jgi:hypothetical protein